MSANKGDSVTCAIHERPAVMRFNSLPVCQQCASYCPDDELFPLDKESS